MGQVVAIECKPNAEALNDPCAVLLRMGGREWPVPHLSVGRICILQPLIHLVGKAFALGVNSALGSEECLRDMVTVVHTALTQAHPTLQRAEIESWPSSLLELQEAFLLVIDQTRTGTKAADPKASAVPRTG